jgi:hypothetical protein
MVHFDLNENGTSSVNKLYGQNVWWKFLLNLAIVVIQPLSGEALPSSLWCSWGGRNCDFF